MIVPVLLGLGFVGAAAWLLSGDDEPRGVETAREEAMRRQWFAVVTSANQSNASDDREGFLGALSILYDIIGDTCAMNLPGVYCDPRGELVSQSEVGAAYIPLTTYPEQYSIEQILGIATQLFSLGYLYEAGKALDFAALRVG